MGLFSTKEEKQAKKDEKTKRFLKGHGLDDLSPAVYQLVRNVLLENDAFTQMYYNVGAVMHGTAAENSMINALNAIVEQNWLLIKQNDVLAKQNQQIIDQLNKKN